MSSVKKPFILKAQKISSAQVWEVMNSSAWEVSLSEEGQHRIESSRLRVEEILNSGKTVYGINTGFGALAQVRISNDDLSILQKNLIRSHCVGVGEEFPD